MEKVKLTMLGQMDNSIDNTFESANRVYDCNGLCPTIPTMAGGNIEPKTIVAMRGRNPDNTSDRTVGSPTLTTENTPSVVELADEEFYNFLYDIDGVTYLIRIRKLIPLECWRLMGFTDEDFHKAEQVNSNSQLYKQAGNSIVVDVLYYLFKNLFDKN